MCTRFMSLPRPPFLFALLSMLFTLSPRGADLLPAAKTTLGIDGTRFTINDKPTFLLGFSYYGALGASKEFIRHDLDDFQRFGFNWLRVWATWDAFDHSISPFDLNGDPLEPYFSHLKWLVADCDRRGLIVDITLSRQNTSDPKPTAGQIPNFESHLRAVEALCNELK